eukprot:7387158-Alexandrium_andersonii.AAC.1
MPNLQGAGRRMSGHSCDALLPTRAPAMWSARTLLQRAQAPVTVHACAPANQSRHSKSQLQT